MFQSFISGVFLSAAIAQAAPPAEKRTEFQMMFEAILGGSDMGPGDGWFKPAESRYTWDRLRARFDRDKDGRITASEFGGSPQMFAALDRDGDGAITAEDLNWADNAPYFRQLGIAQQLLRQADNNGNKKLSKAEWTALFDRMAKGQEEIEAEAVRRMLFPPTPPASKGGSGMPPRAILLLGLLKGEIGSASEGPRLESLAPDFTLSSPDGKTTITMSDSRGKKPVVLIFGSFT